MKKKMSLVAIGVITVLIVALFVANIFSVRPYIAIFRGATKMRSSEINLGSFEDNIVNVEQSATIDLEVAGQSNVQATVYKTKNTQAAQPLIFLIHGGGWSGGSAESISDYAKLIASNGFVVANVDYALAPENPYPSSTIQLAALLDYMYEHSDQYGFQQRSIFIGGNSAGAHLSSQLAALIANPRYQEETGIYMKVSPHAIRGLLLMNGVYDFTTVANCNFPGLDKYLWAYTGMKQWESYSLLNEMSPLLYVNQDFPKSFITAGDVDPLLPQSLEFEEKLKSEGIETQTVFWEKGHNLNHDYMFDLTKEESQTFYQDMVEFIQSNASN